MSSSVECLRGLIKQRLTAAAEDIFTVCLKTIVEYQKEIDHQRRLLEAVLTPGVKLHAADLPQQHVCKEEEVLTDQEKNSSLDQEDPGPPQIKEEQEELCSSLDREDPDPPQVKEEQEDLCTSLEGEQLVLKQETDTFTLITTCETSDNSEDETLDLKLDETQIAAENEDIVIVLVKDSVEPEPSNICTNNQNFKCDTCEKTFEKKCYLHKHLRVHSEEKLYPCDFCEKRFLSLDKLKGHLRVHTGERPYQCTACEKTFSQVTNLKNHMRVHTGEMPHRCNTCEKTFSRLSSLKDHLRVHTGERPYQCTTCGKRFSYLSNLNRHMKVHTGEKPYLCNTCGKRFSQLKTLKGHLRRHTRRDTIPL